MALTKIPAGLLDKSAHVDFADSERLRIGTDNDLQIYYDGTNNLIQGSAGNVLYIQAKAGENSILAVPDGAVNLYHNNLLKFETSATGASVTGNLAVSGNLTVSGTTTELDTTNLNVTDKNITLNYHASSDTSSNADGAGITIQDAVNSSTDATLNWSASNDRFVMSHGLQVTSGVVQVAQWLTHNSTNAAQAFGPTGAFGSSSAIGRAGGTNYHIGGSAVGDMCIAAESSKRMLFGTSASGNPSLRMLIDSSGNVGIGTSSPNAVLTTDPESGNFSSTYNNYDGVGLFIRGNGTSGNGNYGPALAFGSCDSDTTNQDHKHAAISIVQTGTDPNETGLAFWTHPTTTAADALAEKMRIDSSGNVLINTSSVRGVSFTTKLQIEGTGATSASQTIIRNSNSIDPPYFIFGKSRGTSNGSNTIVQNNDTLGRIRWMGADGSDMASAAAEINCIVNGTPGSNDMPGALIFSTTSDGAASTTERMRIDSAGNVGLGGETTPQTLLHVKGTNNSAGDLYTQVGPGNCPSITIQNAGTTNNNNAAIYFRDDQDMRGSINMRFVNHSTHASELRFATTQANNTREKFVMTAAGQLGINKLSGFDTGGFGTPMLVIKHAANSQWGGINLEANGNDAIFAIGTTDTNHVITGSYRTSAGYKPITIGAAGSMRMRFDTNGRISMGDNTYSNFGSPNYPVHICADGYSLMVESGTGYSHFGSNNTAYFHIVGNRTYYFGQRCEASGGFHTYSDENLKKEITPITGALDNVAKMNGVTFKWKDAAKRGGGDVGKQFGVTAQNMLTVDSELPTKNVDPLYNIEDGVSADDEYYTMDYSRITPFLIEAVKELKTKLEAAEARIKTLEG